jgi:hypothetical protein
MTERLVADFFHPSVWMVHGVEILLAAGVILVALAWPRRPATT